MSVDHIQRYLPFLQQVLLDKDVILTAKHKEIAFLVEIIFNLFNNDCVFLTKTEENALRKEYHHLKALSEERNREAARDSLYKLKKTTFSSLIQPIFALCEEYAF